MYNFSVLTINLNRKNESHIMCSYNCNYMYQNEPDVFINDKVVASPTSKITMVSVKRSIQQWYIENMVISNGSCRLYNSPYCTRN